MPNENLTKSIDSLIEELFSEEGVEKGMSIDIKKDASKTADEALKMVPSSQKDESRGAGRPKQISDVPQIDMDGRREDDYDGAIADKQKEDEPSETSQSKPMDQSIDSNRPGEGDSKPPKSRPFKKSGEQLSDEEYAQFLEFRKARAEEVNKAKKEEELRKSMEVRKEQENLVKSAVMEATTGIRKENEELRKSFKETQELLKAMASQPVRAKSVTGIDALEKAQSPEDKEPESFTKSDLVDAAFELAKSGKLGADGDLFVAELEMTGRIADPNARKTIEKYLESK